MDFPTMYSKRPSPISEAGSELVPNYKLCKKDGAKTSDVMPDGTFENIQDKIDSYYESSEINHVMMRYAAGDKSVIDQVRGVYGDFTNMPTTYAELYQRLHDAKTFFNQLKPEVRELFDNSPLIFFDEMGTESFMKKLASVDEKNNVTPTTEPVTIEPKPNPDERSVL